MKYSDMEAWSSSLTIMGKDWIFSVCEQNNIVTSEPENIYSQSLLVRNSHKSATQTMACLGDLSLEPCIYQLMGQNKTKQNTPRKLTFC